MLSSWEHRDEDTIKASAQGACSVLTAAHRTIGKGRAIPQAGTRVCYLLDNDGGGRKLAEQLIERKVDRERVFHLPNSKGDGELEDFLDPALLAEAASSLARQHLEIEKLVSAADLPKFGKWDFIVQACEKAGVKALKKVPVAYEILELLDTMPSRHVVDRRHFASFKSFAEKIIAKVQEGSA